MTVSDRVPHAFEAGLCPCGRRADDPVHTIAGEAERNGGRQDAAERLAEAEALIEWLLDSLDYMPHTVVAEERITAARAFLAGGGETRA